MKNKNMARAAAKKRVFKKEISRSKAKPRVITARVVKEVKVKKYFEPINLRDPDVALQELLELADEKDQREWLEKEIHSWMDWSKRSYEQTQSALYSWLKYFSLRQETYKHLKNIIPV